MVSFIVYDLVIFAAFIVFVILFLRKNKKNVTRQGIIFLYKTDWGIKLMNSFAEKRKKLLKFSTPLVLISGFALMALIIIFLGESVYVYMKFPIADIIKAPPLAPLIPYLPRLFGLQSFFPPLYFTYFVIAVAIGGVLHEFAHGIYARFHKFKVKSTGFLFLGPIPGAFVEPDEKDMAKATKVQQLSMLGAGTFANLIIALFFAALIWIFFLSTMSAAGVGFSSYPSLVVNTADITIPDGANIEDSLIEVEINGEIFLANPRTLQISIEREVPEYLVFENTGAAQARLRGFIMEVGGEKVTSRDDLNRVLAGRSPGEEVNIKTAVRNGFFDTEPEFEEFEVTLSERDGQAYLVGFASGTGGLSAPSRFLSFALFSGAGTMNPSIYYESSLGSFGWFIYFLLWWIFFINLLLALFNMLPVGPLDGGKFLQYGVESVTKSERAGVIVFKWSTWIIVIALLAMMVKWGVSFF